MLGRSGPGTAALVEAHAIDLSRIAIGGLFCSRGIIFCTRYSPSLVLGAPLLFFNHERAWQRPLVSLRITEKSQYERSAGCGHAFARLIFQEPQVRLTNGFLSRVATPFLP